MNFSVLKKAIEQQFADMLEVGSVFRVDVDKDLMWTTYLAGFAPGTDPIYINQTEHSCHCCRTFIRQAGDMVVIRNGQLISLWNVLIGDKYQPVVDALAALVTSKKITDVFLHEQSYIGTDKSRQLIKGTLTTWQHFYLKLPAHLTHPKDTIGAELGGHRETYNVMYRGLSELTLDAMDIVLDLIGQKSLYRGDEHRQTIELFRAEKVLFDKAANKELDAWVRSRNVNIRVARIRNSVIGTLLVDLSKEGADLNVAVTAFESKVAPENYQRPTALVTQAMIADAKATLVENNLMPSLLRRFATLTDVSVNDVLFADRRARKVMEDVFDDLAAATPNVAKSLGKVEKIHIDTFIEEVLPTIDSLEILIENKHAPNFVSLIGPEDPEALSLTKWKNPFTWSYEGEAADSIKARVKKAGGDVSGYFRFSLSWFNTDDLDAWLDEPGGRRIDFTDKLSARTRGNLDVDMNVAGESTTPVENITYPDRAKMRDGIYTLGVHQYIKRNSSNVGFEVELDLGGQIVTMAYPKAVSSKQHVVVAKIEYKDGKFTILESLPTSTISKEIWGLNTGSYHRVETMMHSPNHWDGSAVGNKHFFFFLEGARNPGKARGFFNEFLPADLNKHRKVLEMVGAKVNVDDVENQLSGLGFSNTQRNSMRCRVRGAFNRDLEITF